MNWKKASEIPPPLRKKILVKVPPYISNDSCAPYPGMAVLSGWFDETREAEFVKMENGYYERVVKPRRYFNDVEPERDCLAENEFEWVEFPE